ncbi:hypothetical protein V6N11_004451 [Hibiscus sabdariffa]|uniref:Uncharacterized protein n=1 Tax=Hibiscus sabdariffa TaxID=183260 RepID=A0ABR2SGB4_9ROSI
MVDTCPLSIHRPICTLLWRVISAAGTDLCSSIALSLGTGDVIHPLDHIWVPMLGPLRPHLLQDADASQVQHVSDLLDIHDRWDIVKLSGLFAPVAIAHILSISCPDASDIPDKPVWSLNDKNIFDVKSAYDPQERYRRSLCHHPYCSACQSALETVVHVLRGGQFVQEVRKCFLPSRLQDSFFGCDTQVWLISNVGKHDLHPAWDLSWHLLFHIHKLKDL